MLTIPPLLLNAVPQSGRQRTPRSAATPRSAPTTTTVIVGSIRSAAQLLINPLLHEGFRVPSPIRVVAEDQQALIVAASTRSIEENERPADILYPPEGRALAAGHVCNAISRDLHDKAIQSTLVSDMDILSALSTEPLEILAGTDALCFCS